MKTRVCLVSNSSSSSFIISVEPDHRNRVFLKLDITKMLGESVKICKTESQLKKCFNDFYNYNPDNLDLHEEDKRRRKVYNDALIEIKNNNAVAIGSIEYPFNDILNYITRDTNIIEIEN